MIESIQITAFHNAELLNFMIDEVKDARTLGKNEIIPTLDELDKVLAVFKKGIAMNKASEYSAKVAALDAVRGEAFRNFMGCIQGETYRPEESHREAARRLIILLKPYRNLNRKSYRNETELMYKLVEVLRSDKYASDVQTVKVTAWIDKMDEANKAFDQLFDLRDNTEGERPVINNREVRHRIKLHYSRLFEIIGALLVLHPDKPLEGFVGRHNERVAKMKTLFALRASIGTKSIQAKRAVLRSLASDLGWPLPAGQQDYEFFAGTRILHPAERRWYCLGKKDDMITLVPYKAKKKPSSPPASNTTIELPDLPSLPPSQPDGDTTGGSGEQGSGGGGL